MGLGLHPSLAGVDAPGDTLWVATYGGPGSGVDVANDVAVSSDGMAVFVTGSADGGTTGDDYATVAYDAATGASLWTAVYNGPGNAQDVAYSAAVSPDGTAVYVTGKSFGGTGPAFDYATIAYDATTGTQRWVRRYNGPGNGYDDAFTVAAGSDGAMVYVTGESVGHLTSFDFATVAYEATTGNEVWVARYTGPGNRQDAAKAMTVSPDGSRVFVTGKVEVGPLDDDYATIAYNAATGTDLWLRRYKGQSNGIDDPFAIAVSLDGTRVVVTGESFGGPIAGSDYATIAYGAATGTALWTRRYNGPAGSDVASSVAVSPDGTRVYVTGNSYSAVNYEDYATIAYDAVTGAHVWLRRYDGPAHGSDYGQAVAVSLDGAEIYVTGFGEGSGSKDDYATIAYDAATSATSWVSRYNGPGNGDDEADGLAVSRGGAAVFVTGPSVDLGNDTDFATVAYATS